ncbi:MAG: succinate dehydrogenase, hydrophobic membrane anchor protein [Anaerolineae bacterium]|nr:succinate dehydrogenase, hydrophobic membrane anchor protein [Anaerolineae bacterium]
MKLSHMRIFQLQRWTAIALLVFMTIHMIVVHYPPFHIDFSIILERLQEPLWKVIDVAFLATVLVHALLGAYMVLTDYDRFSKMRRAIAWVLVVLLVAGFIYGSITIINFQGIPEAAEAMVR